MLFSARFCGHARRGLAPSSDTGSAGGHLRPAARSSASTHTIPDTTTPKTQTTSPITARCQRFSPRRSALWARHQSKRRPHHHQTGGIALHEAPTRRRHAARGLHVVQNPHHFLHVGRHLTCHTWLPCRYTRKHSPSTPSPPLTRYKTRPAQGILGPTRYKTHPARHKTPIFGHFSRAGRILSPSGRQQAEQGKLFRAQTAVTWRC